MSSSIEPSVYAALSAAAYDDFWNIDNQIQENYSYGGVY